MIKRRDERIDESLQVNLDGDTFVRSRPSPLLLLGPGGDYATAYDPEPTRIDAADDLMPRSAAMFGAWVIAIVAAAAGFFAGLIVG